MHLDRPRQPQVYYNVDPRQLSASIADLLIQLDHYDPRATPAPLDRVRGKVASFPGAEITVSELENGPPIDAPIANRVFGDDLSELRRLAADVADTLARTPGTRDVRNPLALGRNDVAVELDRRRAALPGVTEVDVDRAVRLAISGQRVGTLQRCEGEEIDLVVGLPRPGRPDLSALERLELPTVTGSHVPLAHVAELGLTSSPRLIQHDGRERVVTVTAEVQSGANAQRVTTAALTRVDAAGGLMALFLAGETLSFTASIGFVALIGIEVKYSILLLDFTNQLRAEGVPLDDAMRRAGETRFFPILLTSMTAIGGLTPLVVEHSNLDSPLALVLIGGLVASTILSRLVTPVTSKLLLRR